MNQLLLIIDAQQELIDGNQDMRAVFKKEQLIQNINIVIKKAKEANVSIVCVRDLDVAGGKGKGFQVHDEIHLPVETKFFDKAATNSFHGTGLLNYLKSNKINHIVIMGCETQHCIDSAVRTEC